MNQAKIAAFFILIYLLIVHAGSTAAKSSVLIYPESLIAKLGIDSQDIVKNQKKYIKDTVHVEWMAHVHEVIPEINPDKEDMIVKLHTSMLYVKDRINKAYLSGSINQQEFTAQSAELMQWFLKAHQEMLSKKEYESLFGLSQNNESSAVVSTDNELGFPIKNPETTVEMIREKFDENTIAKIARFYQGHAQELRDIKKIYETGDSQAKPEQIKKDMLRIDKELQEAYMNYCRKILSDEQFNLLFGSRGKE